jgi:hypothetical protein
LAIRVPKRDYFTVIVITHLKEGIAFELRLVKNGILVMGNAEMSAGCRYSGIMRMDA